MFAQIGNTAVHCATKNGYLEVVKCLLSHGADTSIQNKVRNIVCHVFILSLYWLYKIFSSFFVTCLWLCIKDGYTALYFAANKGHLEVLQCLINNGADMSAKKHNVRISL